ncbi:hypothetical protein EDF87_11346 [Pseudomonas helmanticensis]|uniref:Uncharacterized protein n=1 Tax=Pseudomonas helmanticensis TaxID=1471381 RepID=A0A4R7V248_9PSED|nr:hypothetical protein [Pseudomonas helmanticensis]TDV42920.1 hypothetical protein EDF87_11346 [Pseudomonas helmanticensis]
MDQNKNNAKTEKTIAQKVALAVSWIIVAASVWYWLSPNEPIPVKPAVAQTAEQQQTPTVYTSASPQALASATQYLADLDSAMSRGVQILKANNLKDLSAHSQHFKTLRANGQAQFGRSVFEPLGHCASAGIFANSWWQAEVSASRNADKETTQGTQSHWEQYSSNKEMCLKAVAA